MRTLSKRIGQGLAAAVTVISLVTLTAGPASARRSDCRSNRMCTWVDQNYAGTNYVPYPWEVPGTTSYADTPSNNHDDGTSWWNNTGRIYCVIDHVSGRVVNLDRLGPNGARPLALPGTNDRIDAVRWC